MQPAAFTIRDLKTYEEFYQVHQLQQTIWGFDEPGIGLYPPFLFTASKNGGVVLGAFDPGDQMIGYIFSFLGREPGGPLKLCSQTMGVRAECVILNKGPFVSQAVQALHNVLAPMQDHQHKKFSRLRASHW